MEATISALNAMVAEGVIGRYAIGGAMAILFHTEPILTHDLDVFVLLPSAGLLVTLEPIYAYARARGYAIDGEHVIVEGVPVQFLPVHDALTEEALAAAVVVPYRTVPAPVLRIEHLLAIMVKLGRAKDRARIAHVLETMDLDLDAVTDVLRRHGLEARWKRIVENLG